MKRRQRHPKVYSVGMVAFSLLFFESLVGTLFMYSLLPKILSGSQMSLQEVYFLVGVVRAIIHAGLWVLVLVAFFGWRNTPRSGKVERAADVGD